MLLLVLVVTPISLEDVKAASRANLQAIQADLQVETAGTNRTVARSAILPRVDVNAGASVNYFGPQRRISVVPKQCDEKGVCEKDANGQIIYVQKAVDNPDVAFGNFSLGLTVSQLLYDGGRWWNRMAQTASLEEAARGQYAEQQLASELEAVRRFYELVRAQLTLKVLRSSIERSKDQLMRATSLYEAGRGQRRDVLDAEVNVGNDEILAMRQEQSIASAQVELLQWLGRPSDDIEAVVPDEMSPQVVAVGAPSSERVLSLARQQRPLMHALESQVRANELSVEVAKADYFPRVSINGGYSRNAPAIGLFVDPTRQNGLFAGVNIDWNVFGGFATAAATEAARIQVRLATAQQRQAIADLDGEIRRTLRTLETQLRISGVAEKNRNLSEKQLSIEVERFNAGASSNIDVRNAQVKVTQAQLTQLQGRVDVEIARAALHRVSGAPVGGAP